MLPTTLKQEWLRYAQQALPLASTAQLHQSQSDFYAGMLVMLQQVTALGDASVSEEMAMLRLQMMQDELLSTIQENVPGIDINKVN